MLHRRCGVSLSFHHPVKFPAQYALARLRRSCCPRALATSDTVNQMLEHRAQVTLWITCASMAVGAYLPGLVALMLPSKKRSSNLASTASAGLLLGAGLCVILPEGFHSLDEAQEALSESQRLPEWAAGAALLAGFMMMIAFDMLRPKHDEAHGHIHADQQPFQSLVPSADAPSAQQSGLGQWQPDTSGGSSPRACQHTTLPAADNSQLATQRSASCHECCLPECTWKPDVCDAADTALIITDSAVPVDEVLLKSSHRLSAEHQADSRQHQGHAGQGLVHRHVNGDGDEAGRYKGRSGCGGSGACMTKPLLEEQHEHDEGMAGGSAWSDPLSAVPVVSAASIRAANQACVGLVLHSAADGLAVGAAALSSNLAVPITIALSIMAHKMPVGYGLAAFLRTNCRSWEAAHAGLLSFAAAAPLAALATYYVFGQTPWASQPQAVAIALLASGGTVLHAGAIHVLPTAGNRPIDLIIMFTCSLIPLVIGALIPEA